jgi:flagellar protein FlaG
MKVEPMSQVRQSAYTTTNESTVVDNHSTDTETKIASNSVNEKTNLCGYVQRHPEYTPTVGEKAVLDAIEKANKKLSGVQAEFEFSVHEKTKQIMVKVLNKETKEVIREIPPEKVLDMVARFWEMAGIMIDEKM